MSTESALSVLAQVDQVIDSAKSAALMRGRIEFWQRDKAFVDSTRQTLLSREPARLRSALDEMRNLSQGFGSYCTDRQRIDRLLDAFHDELIQLIP